MKAISLAGVVGLCAMAGVASGQCSSNASASSSGCSWDKSKDSGSVTMASYNEHAPDIVDTALSAGSFETLVAAVKAAGLVDLLKSEGPFTVFAPTDEAFARLPGGTVESLLKPENKHLLIEILKYHVVPGEVKAAEVVTLNTAETAGGQRADIRVDGDTVRIDDARVTATDIMTSNGVIHVIDRVIMPETNTIVEVASEAGSFGTLLKAAKAAGLADLLGSEGPFTVLAPTDEAFAALGQHTIRDLLKPANKHKLAAILKYHVIPGRVFADEAIGAATAETAQGGDVRFGIRDARLAVNNATIVATDIEASNGVIHVIDTVLLPR